MKGLPHPDLSGVNRVKNRITEIQNLFGRTTNETSRGTFVEVLDKKMSSAEKALDKDFPFPSNVNSSRSSKSNPSPSYIDGIIEEKCRKYGVDGALVRAVIKMESGGNPRAVSKAGAMGLMQLMPSTAEMLGVKDPFNPEENLDGGIRYLKMLLEKYRGDEKLALAAYHSGPSRVDKWGGVPPYPIVRHYVKTVLALKERAERE
ncbi:MAG: hypothetical protein PWP05_1094 [Thermovirga sp.]|nr:hypothetical protein [Thermovirga sp.]MDN5368379.1 hypothetical protein [Thermovirga sp.]